VSLQLAGYLNMPPNAPASSGIASIVPARLLAWLSENDAVLSNAGSLFGTTLATSFLGFIYWWVAARVFPVEAVGVASAGVSAMTLLAVISSAGLATTLVGELPKRASEAPSLIATAIVITILIALAGGVAFSLLAPFLASELGELTQPFVIGLVFAAGVMGTSVAMVLDSAMIGLLQGWMQFWRNTIFSLCKIVTLLIAGIWMGQLTGLGIYVAWFAGIVLSIVIIVKPFFSVIPGSFTLWPKLEDIPGLGWAALSHHSLNLAFQAPGLLLPVVVISVLSASASATFYVSLMIANLAYVVPNALTTVLYAIGSSDPHTLRARYRTTLISSFLVGIASVVGMFAIASPLLGLFGPSYAEQSSWSLRILSLAIFPISIKFHYIAVCRLTGGMKKAATFFTLAGGVELALAAGGAMLGGLNGLSIGWVAALGLQSIMLWPTVFTASQPHGPFGNYHRG
jgi:O-antigen/teichoic acid export membrane protein